MKSPLFLSLLLVFSGIAVGKVKYYVYISTRMNWTDAQSYCRRTYTDLATIASVEENQKVLNTVKNYQGWIGMNRISTYDFWKWSDGEQTSIFYWYPGEPNDKFNYENCVRCERLV